MSEKVLNTLSNKTRLQILICLSGSPKNVTQLINICGLSQSAVSQHLHKLRDAGLVVSEKEGKEVYYHIVHPKSALLSTELINFVEEIEK